MSAPVPPGDAGRPPVTVVGAGLAGSMMAIYLAREGFAVEVYERRADPRRGEGGAGRSINLGLSARGLRALERAGLADTMRAQAVVMAGRAVHRAGGRVAFHAYGKDPSEVLHSIDRMALNRLLIDTAEGDGARFHFGQRCVGLDKAARTLRFDDRERGTEHDVAASLVIGADGAFSAVRQHLHAGERADFHQEYLPWGYKELTLPPDQGGGSQVRLDALHVWPRGDALIVTHPNRNGSHTVTLFLPFERGDGRFSFAELTDRDQVARLFDAYFPDLVPIMPRLLDEFFEHPVGRLVTTRTAPWHDHDWAVLIGDAVHAVYPFYGQGMNAALEDCVALAEAIRARPAAAGFDTVFRTFQAQRKRHTDTLAELSKRNFLELSERLRSPVFVLRKQLDVALNRLFPGLWKPLYTMVAHSTIPYADAVVRARRQSRWLRGLAIAAAALLGAVALWLWG